MTRQIVRLDNALDYPGHPISAASKVGNLIFTSGVVALDPVSGEVVPGGVAEQARQSLQNVEAVLAAAGASLDDIIMMKVFLSDIESDLAPFNAVYGEFFPNNHPPRYAVGVTLAWPILKVELHAVAQVKDA